jgi:hypothetical protein
MAQWADYLISEVRYDAAGTHVTEVLSHVDHGDTVGAAIQRPREWVIGLLEEGRAFVTIYRDGPGQWSRGAEVVLVLLNGEKHLRTDSEVGRRDNLGDLPMF